MSFTIGADVENFLTKTQKGKTKFMSAARILKGTKYEPVKMKCGAGLHKDNVAAEFASEIAETEDQFVRVLVDPQEEILELVGDMELSKVSYASFPKDQVTLEEEQRFGCEPDYDAWEVTVNRPPVPPTKTFRSCGGHVHVGFKDYESPLGQMLADPYGKLNFVKVMDVFLGVPFVLLDRESAPRRKLYGRAGSHRPKDYGVEYRVLSNKWTQDENMIRFVYKIVSFITENLDLSMDIMERQNKEEITLCINDSDVDTAAKIVENELLPVLDPETSELFQNLIETENRAHERKKK